MTEAVFAEPLGYPLWHLAHVRDWEEAQESGEYAVSTRGRTLAQEGFIHCSFPHQLPVVARTFYADDPEPLCVLEIDPVALSASGAVVNVEAIEEGSDERYPHIYGAIPVGAVTSVRQAAFVDGALQVLPLDAA